jgi:transposase
MNEKTLFQLALGLTEPWFVGETKFDPAAKRLDLFLDFRRGHVFPCPECGRTGKAHDTEEKTWRHLNFFQHEAYLHARVPRMRCEDHGVRLVEVPWGRRQSGFTLLFEALVMMLAREMPVKAIAELLGVTDQRLWRVLRHYVMADVESMDLTELSSVGVDETAARRGHNYVSLFVDMDERKVVFVTEGKDAQTLEAFTGHLAGHGGAPEAVTEVVCDMSPAFISGVEAHLPEAAITFDRFHVIKLLNTAVDEVRREERRTEPSLKSTRYIWLKNPGNLTNAQAATVHDLSRSKLKTARAYRMKLVFQEIYRLPGNLAEAAIEGWYQWGIRSRLEPIVEFARMLRRHWDGILRWFTSKLNNGLLEALNSLVQAAKARARGYRSVENFKLMIYLIAGHLGLLPT